jgi:predicted CXXCH cytochrome family protein
MHLSAHTGVERVWRCRRGVLAAGVVLLLLGGFVLWKKGLGPTAPSPTAPSRDPRLDYAGPFQNVHPGVGYVGDARCAECHEDKAQTYHEHPMARSLLPIAAVAPRQPYDASHRNPFEALGRRFWVERCGERVWHGQEPAGGAGDPAVQLRSEVHYAIGSGTRGYSYLTSRDGFLFLTPVSWFSSKQIWDVTPGSRIPPEQPVAGECLFCHANRAPVDEGPQNYFEGPIYDGQGIGCERCHGPGERHVQDPGRRDPATGADPTIVNPRHLDPHLREAVCEQCHLQGESRLLRRGRGLYDFRPGLPLEQFWSVFVRGRGPGEQDRAVNHVEQMYSSRCFQGSAGRMGCISCHDPHVAVGPQQRVSHYRDRCLACHQEQGCGLLPAQRRQTRADDSCIDCHMPRYPAADIAHAAATDHRILRRAGGKASSPEPAGRVPSGPPPAVVSFYRNRLDPHDPEAARDLAVALVRMTFNGKIKEFAYPEPPLPLLEQAVQRDPDDVDAGEARAGLLMLQWRFPEALAAFESVLARRPRRERSLAEAAYVAQKLRRREEARRYWERAATVNPWIPYYRQSLALLLAEDRAWEDCRRQCEAWLRLDPANTEARALWAKCLASTGRLEEARGELARLERLHAPSLAELRLWFAERAPGRPADRGGVER